jgi:uncharacterized protein YecE (DUF72 family)
MGEEVNYTGCSGWSYDHWIDKFYPSDLERKEWLKLSEKYVSYLDIHQYLLFLKKA